MMNFTKKAGAVAATTLLLATSADAAVFNASASFRTIADISITEAASLSFGTSVSGKAGTTCTLTSVITAGAAAALTNVDAFAFPADVGGDGCNGTTDAVNGDYLFTGAAGTTVTVLMATVTDTDFTFAPAGQYNDQAAALADVSTTYFSDAAFNVVLNGAAGTGRLSVGGTLSIINDLTASTSYSVAYDVSVVY
jgi:hypothetical protein